MKGKSVREEAAVSRADVIHELYEQCKDMDFDESYQLIKNARSEEERDFIRLVADFILQQKQKKVIQENMF